MPYDLFNDVIITDDDIFDWVSAVAPRWLYSERSYVNYVRSYDVVGKIRSAKIRGTYDETIANGRNRKAWHDRLAIDMIRPTH